MYDSMESVMEIFHPGVFANEVKLQPYSKGFHACAV